MSGPILGSTLEKRWRGKKLGDKSRPRQALSVRLRIRCITDPPPHKGGRKDYKGGGCGSARRRCDTEGQKIRENKYENRDA